MDKKQNFEASLKELEGVVKALEGGEVSLDEMLTLFERGIYLTKECTTALDSAEQKISVLMKNRDNGEMEEQPFAGLGE
jgi:exodeoxyribonuclease VII small subunit